jgi:hypothetical protein
VSSAERYGFGCPSSQVIIKNYSEHMAELEIAFVSLRKTKTGKPRHIRLNAVAVAAFKVLQKRSLNGEGRFFVTIQGSP